MIFQSFNLLPRMTPQENIELPLRLAETNRAIACALVNRPKILLADEPTGNLGSATGEAIHTLLREQSQLGMTMVMVTHERALAENFADRLAIMGDGKLLSTSSGKGFAQ